MERHSEASVMVRDLAKMTFAGMGRGRLAGPFPTGRNQPHMIHGFMGWTGTLRFLAWHRAFLPKMEKVLQNHVPGVTIPYSRWANDHELPTWVRPPAGVTRGPDTHYQLPNQGDIDSNVPGAGDYITMTQGIENRHNTVHMYQ